VKNAKKLIGSIVVTQLAGILGAVFTTPSISTWYATVNKPVFNPPNWIFGPVWTLLYLMMGVALYLVIIEKNSANKKVALKYFWIQLGLNTLWSIIFFGMQLPALALLEIVILWYMILMTIRKFLPISKTAGYLLVPYILWVSFASVLNLAIAILN
jgi:translocator protein